jgi:hypothetical protein
VAAALASFSAAPSRLHFFIAVAVPDAGVVTAAKVMQQKNRHHQHVSLVV